MIVELVKLRFAELVELGQTDETNDGQMRQTHRDAALELWPIIRDIELQIPQHRRLALKSARIIGPLRDWQAALKKVGIPDTSPVAPPARAVLDETPTGVARAMDEAQFAGVR